MLPDQGIISLLLVIRVYIAFHKLLLRHADSIMTTNNYAFPLTAIDREILAMKDEDFALVTWEELKEIIGDFPISLYHVSAVPANTHQPPIDWRS